jgi:hypothetical protein
LPQQKAKHVVVLGAEIQNLTAKIEYEDKGKQAMSCMLTHVRPSIKTEFINAVQGNVMPGDNFKFPGQPCRKLSPATACIKNPE